MNGKGVAKCSTTKNQKGPFQAELWLPWQLKEKTKNIFY
jgi:hypothetical protein